MHRLEWGREDSNLRKKSLGSGSGFTPNKRDSRHAVARALAERDGLRCFYCGCEFTTSRAMNVDHVVNNGPDCLDNLVLACAACNARKSRTPGWLFVVLEELRTWEQKRYRQAWIEQRLTYEVRT